MTSKSYFNQSELAMQLTAYRHHERGVALIVVLLFLILIMLAGAMAVRQSNNDLKTATADQINSQLLQSADSANQKLETIVNGNSNSKEYKAAFDTFGVFGYFLPPFGANNKTQEFVYCYKPTNTLYDMNSSTVYQQDGGTIANNGICDYNNPEDFTTQRQTVMTQVSVTPTRTGASTGGTSTPTDSEPFSNMAEASDSVNSDNKNNIFDIRTIAALPSYNEPKGCFAEHPAASATAASRTLACLHEKNTPSKMLFTRAALEQKNKKTDCIKLGQAGAADVNADGTLKEEKCQPK